MAKITRKLIGLLLIATVIFLNGCSTVQHKDGPPDFSVDESRIPNAVPKKEPLSKYGNLDTYRVFGKSYHTMKSSKHYVARGTASWYGTQFHASRTSSGERYNMLAMTAAHKTLPLPTYVEVTNLANNRKIVVKVNDRGPFEGNRLIDLSYVAAKKLGMLGHGTAHVEVRALDPDTYYKHILTEKPTLLAHNHTTHKSSNLYLQVGVFKNRQYAEHLKTRLTKVLPVPVQVAHTSHTSKGLFRVQVGPIKNVATENQISKHLKSIGLTSTKKIKSPTEV